MFYVKMVDTFLSGWGMAEGKTSRIVIQCETLAEAKIVEENAKLRTDMKNVSIVTTRPSFNEKTNRTVYTDKEGFPRWFEPKFFARESE